MGEHRVAYFTCLVLYFFTQRSIACSAECCHSCQKLETSVSHDGRPYVHQQLILHQNDRIMKFSLIDSLGTAFIYNGRFLAENLQNRLVLRVWGSGVWKRFDFCVSNAIHIASLDRIGMSGHSGVRRLSPRLWRHLEHTFYVRCTKKFFRHRPLLPW